MDITTRYLKEFILSDLVHKMVFVGGARQSGKTTLAKEILKTSCKNENWKRRYFNWDDDDDRESMLKREWPIDPGCLVLDEIHKYKNWRNLVKGLFDKRNDELNIIVTGSARLDYYRHGGDSLQGRYHYYRLHPLSFKETGGESFDDVMHFMQFGSFPEPFLRGSTTLIKRWSREYRTRLIRDELVSLEKVNEVSLIELLAARLPDCVGSPLSINSLREDLHVAHQTVSHWVEILERMYSIFRIYPFGTPKLRAVKKEAKHYHFDWTQISSESSRFENLIASHLLKHCHFIEDTRGEEMELRYFRDIDKREVDFVLMQNKKPILFVEAKLSDKEISPHLKYLKERFPEVKAVQVYLRGNKEFRSQESNIDVMPAHRFLQALES